MGSIAPTPKKEKELKAAGVKVTQYRAFIRRKVGEKVVSKSKVFSTRTEAKAWIVENENSRALNALAKYTGPTFGTLIEDFVEAPPDRGTRYWAESHLAFWKAELGHKKAGDISRADINAAKARLQVKNATRHSPNGLKALDTKLTPATVNRYLASLSSVFNYAVNHEIIEANALSVTFPALRDEVNIADFFALELIRLNVPTLYATIRENEAFFVGASQYGLRSRERQTEADFHDAWAAKLDDRLKPGLQGMLERIFPRLDNMGRGSDVSNEWRRTRRAASPDVFPTFFAFCIDQDQVSRREILEFIEGLDDQNKTKQVLLDAVDAKRTDGTSKAEDYLEQLLDHKEELTPSKATNLLLVLGDIADELLLKLDRPLGFFGIRPIWRLNWVLQHALARIQRQHRDANLVTAFRAGQSLTFLCYTIPGIEDAIEKGVSHGSAKVLAEIEQQTIEVGHAAGHMGRAHIAVVSQALD